VARRRGGLSHFLNLNSACCQWLAGIIDSDASIGIVSAGQYVRVNLEISNQDLVLLEHIKRGLNRLGYCPTGPYKRHPEGFVAPGWNIKYNKDMYYLAIQRVAEVKEILKLTPLLHQEKCMRKELVLTSPLPPGGKPRDQESLLCGVKQVAQFRLTTNERKSRMKIVGRERLPCCLPQSRIGFRPVDHIPPRIDVFRLVVQILGIKCVLPQV
jgi:hypothetical protein